jgi:sigma-B regulation protein RsbU (phosphoserine phosphatase)
MAGTPQVAPGQSAVRREVPRDVESLKKALRESEARYRRLLDAVTDYAYAVRFHKGEPVDTRHGVGCLQVTGYHPEDFEADPFLWIDIVHPEDRDAVLQRSESVVRGDVPPLEHRILHRDGTTRWVCSTIIRHVEAGDLVRYDGILTDVTERRRLQESLRASSDFLQTVLDAIPEVTLVVNTDRQIILANRAAQEWTDERTPIVDALTCGELFYPNDPENCVSNEQCPVAKVLSSGTEVMVTRSLRSPSGSQVVVEMSAAPISDGEGKVAAVVMSCRDITRRRRIEQALYDNEVQLLMAQKIQEHLLPETPPRVAGYDIGGVLYPAEFAAGDYYDFLHEGDDRVDLVIGDVTGHGFSAALIMSLTQVLLRLLVEAHEEIPQVLRHANAVLSRATDEYHFVTLFFGRLDARRGKFVYSSAGHPPGYLLDRNGEVKAFLESTSHPLGMFSDIAFPIAGVVSLAPGDTLVLVTDGIEETLNADEEHFGRGRLVDAIRRHRHLPADEIAKTLCRSAREFAGRSSSDDDTTVVVVRVLEE